MNIDELPILRDLPREKLDEAAGLLTSHPFKKGDTLFQEGEAGTHLWFILEGEVKVFKEYASGKSAILGLFGPGGTVAEVPVIDGRSYPATCQAVTDGVAATMRRDLALEFISSTPLVALRVLGGLAGKLRDITADLGSMAVQSVIRRLSRFILKLAGKMGGVDGTELDLPLTRKDLAECIGTSFEVAVRCLGKLQDEGVLEVDGRKIRILDPARLKKMSEG